MAHELAQAIGHRGVPTQVAENSIAGLELAARLGYRWCEIDVQASSDGIAVLHHDFRFRSAPLTQVSSLTAAQLAARPIGPNPDGGAQLTVPTLREACTVATRAGLGLVVELKVERGRQAAVVDAVVREVADVARRPAGLLLASFDIEALRLLRDHLPGLPLAFNVGGLPKDPPSWVANIHCDWRKLKPEQVPGLRDAGYGIYAYTVNDADVRDRLLATGVQGVFTDDAALLVRE